MATHLETGKQAERQALAFLTSQGLQRVTQNYRCALGEIDLIMQEGSTLIFVEVRFRGKNSFSNAAQSITLQKQRRLIRAAQCYLMSEGQSYQYHHLRFDAVLLDQRYKIDWIKNAFEVQC